MKRNKHENLEMTHVETGEGRCHIRARVLPMGDNLIIAVTGGKAHIGAAALGEPYSSRTGQENTRASVSVLTRISHKEDAIAGHIASRLASILDVPVLVCCGIHLDNITPDEIKEINRNAETLIILLVEVLRSQA